MSILHRRKHTTDHAYNSEPETIPAWAELQKLTEAEAVAMAAAHGIESADRLDAIGSLNNRRKEQSK
ncbi:hypothetical protein [Zhongshania sp. BJYM1]|uniref:hypothetical protein n=1 Tax=Zhongshania aquatica TaxID=2965069 RepID=UPI0022B5C7CE|nr:hypothetical protein [Marortus sp. BJYM1]